MWWKVLQSHVTSCTTWMWGCLCLSVSRVLADHLDQMLCSRVQFLKFWSPFVAHSETKCLRTNMGALATADFETPSLGWLGITNTIQHPKMIHMCAHAIVTSCHWNIYWLATRTFPQACPPRRYCFPPWVDRFVTPRFAERIVPSCQQMWRIQGNIELLGVCSSEKLIYQTISMLSGARKVKNYMR